MAIMVQELSVARQTLQQLGGHRFITMTGAHTLVGHPDALSFNLPSRFARDGINYVKITLTPMDVYHMEFGRVWRGKYTVKATEESVYNDNLQTVFSRITGLNTHL